ncbi:MAG TPA: PDZ domain-containing protein [Longimicrobiaceae bacterium]|jgi:predicted metalloprotease with PDZ domain|nr:PDZ domain-containing protein [Longimicrobiaceae bacterium]
MKHTRIAALLGALTVLCAPALAAQGPGAQGPGRGWMGIAFSTTSENGRPARTVVEEVFPGSAAEKAGVQAGDTVVAINGRDASEEAVTQLRTNLRPGETVRLRVRHGGRDAERVVVAGARPGPDRIIADRVIRIGRDSMRQPMIFRLDSLGSLSIGPEMERMMGDSVRVLLRRLPRDGRVLSDSIRRHVDSLVFRMDSLRTRVRILSDGRLRAFRMDTTVTRAMRDAEGRRREIVIRTDRLRGDAERVRVDAERLRGQAERFRVEAGRTPFFMELGRRAVAGAEFTEMNAGLGRYFGTSQGLLVVQVSPSTPAARAGLQAGDVVTSVDGQAVRSVSEFRARMARGSQGRAKVVVMRDRRRRELSMQWDSPEVRTFQRVPAPARPRQPAPPAPPRN